MACEGLHCVPKPRCPSPPLQKGDGFLEPALLLGGQGPQQPPLGAHISSDGGKVCVPGIQGHGKALITDSCVVMVLGAPTRQQATSLKAGSPGCAEPGLPERQMQGGRQGLLSPERRPARPCSCVHPSIGALGNDPGQARAPPEGQQGRCCHLVRQTRAACPRSHPP